MTTESSVVTRSFWRDAAVILLPARWPASNIVGKSKQTTTHSWDYKMLLVKRSAKSLFSSNYVYPGGTVSDADYDPRWIDLFRSLTSLSLPDIMASLQVSNTRPPMTRKVLNGVPADIALRICAIRETFEEAGVLLAEPASRHASTNLENITRRSKSTEAHLERDIHDLQKWRAAIQTDPTKFHEMCVELNLVPNIWSLVEWSNWLTPPLTKVDGPVLKPKRFDTMYYMCFLESPPDVVVDDQEIVGLDWLTPPEVIGKRAAKSITTGFHQTYESLRLSNFSRYDDLLNFAVMRSRLGLERTFGVILMCKDGGLILVHNGDELFPKNPDVERTADLIKLDKTREEAVLSGELMDRSVISPSGMYKIIYNLRNRLDGHLPLLEEEDVLKLFAQNASSNRCYPRFEKQRAAIRDSEKAINDE